MNYSFTISYLPGDLGFLYTKVNSETGTYLHLHTVLCILLGLAVRCPLMSVLSGELLTLKRLGKPLKLDGVGPVDNRPSTD